MTQFELEDLVRMFDAEFCGIVETGDRFLMEIIGMMELLDSTGSCGKVNVSSNSEVTMRR